MNGAIKNSAWSPKELDKNPCILRVLTVMIMLCLVM